MSLPDDVREALKVAMSDKQTPYVSRRNKSYDDGRIYEVIRLDNPDWRDVITDDQTVMGRFPNDKEANALCADLEAEFRLDAILSALEAAGWEVNPTGTGDALRLLNAVRAEDEDAMRSGDWVYQQEKNAEWASVGEDSPEQDVPSTALYRGNSVGWIYSKAENYKRALSHVWDVLQEFGMHPDGKTHCADAVRAMLSAAQEQKP